MFAVRNAVTAEDVQLVQQSLGRCLLNKSVEQSFLDAFYDAFLASDSRIPPMFDRTDMTKQKNLLRQGLTMLLMYSKNTPLARSAIEQLAIKHSRRQLNIAPELYPLWVNSLLTCVEKYDPDFDASLREKWHQSLATGIEAMTKAY